jgi:hypothetical protein
MMLRITFVAEPTSPTRQSYIGSFLGTDLGRLIPFLIRSTPGKKLPAPSLKARTGRTPLSNHQALSRLNNQRSVGQPVRPKLVGVANRSRSGAGGANERRTVRFPLWVRLKHPSSSDGIQPPVVSCQDLSRPAQAFQGAGHEADGPTMIRCKGEITRCDLKRKA